MLLLGPPGGADLCGLAGGSGSPNMPLLFPPTKGYYKTVQTVITNVWEIATLALSVLQNVFFFLMGGGGGVAEQK